MALSGSFSGSIKSGNYKLRVDWSATQNVANNTSKITATMYLVIASGWSLNIASRSDNTTAIAGSSNTWSSPAINKGGSTTKLATVTSGNITHNSDGTKSVTLTATFYVRATISGTYYEKITASATVTLNTIPRATTPTLSSSSVYMGDSVTINTPRASSSFTHDLAYQFAGGSWVNIATGVGTSRAWTVPNLSSSIPNASSGTMTIRCITKNGSTTIGTKTVVLTVKVPTDSGYNPSISAVSVTEATAGLGAQFGRFIQNKSKLKVKITATASAGATIKSISTTFLGSTYTGSEWTTGLVGQSGTLSMVTKVTDSRGRTASKTTNVSVLAYSKPMVYQFEAYRVNADTGEADEDGTMASVHFRIDAPSLNGGNYLDWELQYKRSTDTTWTTLEWLKDYYPKDMFAVAAAEVTLLTEQDTLTNALFSTDNQYDLRIIATDYFGAQSVYMTVLPSGDVIADILADGSGIGIGKTAELSGVCDIGMQTRLLGGLLWVEAPTGTNLNTLMTPGYFRLTSAGTYTNGPESGVGAMLEVMGQGTIVQRWTAASKTRPRAYERSYFDGAWGQWVKVFDVVPNRVYTGVKYVQITTADVDTRVDGAEVTVPAGTYIITASATFNTATSSGTRNNEIRLMAGDGNVVARQRIVAGTSNFAEMRVADVYTVTSSATFTCQKSSSITEKETALTSITAVRLF